MLTLLRHMLRLASRRPAVLVACLAVTVGGGVALVWLRRSGSAQATTPSPISLQAVRAAALRLAAQNGESSPQAMETVLSTHAHALAVTDPGTGISDASPAYLVSMHGRFTGLQASVPRGAPMPTGTTLTLVLSAADGEVTDWGIDNSSPNLSTLGPVHQLAPLAQGQTSSPPALVGTVVGKIVYRGGPALRNRGRRRLVGPRAQPGRLRVLDQRGRAVRRMRVRPGRHFHFALRPGVYRLVPRSGDAYCLSRRVRVRVGARRRVNVRCIVS